MAIGVTQGYWGKFRRRTYAILAAAQIIIATVGLGVMQAAGITQLDILDLLLAILLTASILSVITIALVHIVLRPFRDLVDMVVSTTTDKTPTHAYNKAYDRDGFNDILRTVYELAARDKVQETTSVQPDSVALEGLNYTPTGFVMYNSEGEIIYKNHSAPVRTDIGGKSVLDIIFPENDTFTGWLEKNKDNDQMTEYRWTRVADKLPGEKDRRIFDVVANYHKGSSAQTIVTLYDRTNLYMPEEDEFDFISFAAHELRGPITVIRGYLDVLDDELGPLMEKDQVELIQRLVVSSNRLTTYINNILNAARYDRRHMKLHLSENNVRSIYDGIADDMQLRASSQNRLLVADIPDTLPTVASDNNSVGEVLSNLIDNAIKYSNEGGLVHVVARPVPGFVEISVIDRGIGMPVSVMPNLFHKFYRSHRSRETVAGTGIGLYICKAIVSSHGGTITARSIENEGSTFSFTLPIYDTVAEKLKANDNSNQLLIEHGSGWIRNHSLYRG